MYTAKAIIVEDQDQMADMFEDTLRLVGYDVKHIRDGQDAINFFETDNDENIFMIMLDINLPHVGGHDIYKKISTMPRYERVPIIMSTANTYMANKVQPTMREQDYLFIKPLNLYELQRIAKLHKPSTGKLKLMAEDIETDMALNPPNTPEEK